MRNEKQFKIKLAEDKKELQQELLTEAVLNKLLSCKKSERSELEDKEWNALVWLLRWCGCRIAELSILRWEDINFDSLEIKMRGKRSGNQRATSETMRVRLMPPVGCH